ncbi:MAG: bifunctional phosphoribosylaminoimidazolecarboxamide formyltransferase/IMP cyclohydrolase [DPANN group archaeon]|nr:bifunctional phosphoribosylaminoimidazolecarboxamide formyltransferase/IMP cyclohydrolase [DPANN group archaeon]
MDRAKQALLSVFDKRGIVEFAKGLKEKGWDIISTGGTAKLLSENDVLVRKVSDVTGFPEILDGRVKTLHPKIHGGILARRTPSQLSQLEEQGITPIDLVVVNLYPFEQVTAKDHTFDQALENIDIGGPTMIRAAAKNQASVGAVVDPGDYSMILEALDRSGRLDDDLKASLARKAFAHTARYDAIISSYLERHAHTLFPPILNLTFEKKQDLRYGENPHQQAALYQEPGGEGIVTAEQLNGKALSFNNLMDADAAHGAIAEFDHPATVIVKHTNPCGVAMGTSLSETYALALACDRQSSFGGIVAFNRKLDLTTAEQMKEMFFEIIIAPDYEEKALELLRQKKNLRVLRLPLPLPDHKKKALQYKRIAGGLLVQDEDRKSILETDLETVTKSIPSPGQVEDMLFGWKVARHVKSNTILFIKGKRTIGIGAGQMSRIDAAFIAKEKAAKAGHDLKGSVMVSDAFFPFRDTVDLAASLGVAAIIQPGGSIRDQESIDACDENRMAMVFTRTRAFRH